MAGYAEKVATKGIKKRRTRGEHAIIAVRRFITTNRLKPGDALPSERDLALHLKISRPILREALQSLTSHGLIETKHGSPRRVRLFTYDQIVNGLVDHFHMSGLNLRQIIESRCALEVAALSFIIERATPTEIEGLRQIEVELEMTVEEGGDYRKIEQQWMEFYLEMTGNEMMSAMIGVLRAFVEQPPFVDKVLDRGFSPEERGQTMQTHRDLVDAIAARDLDWATRVMREHFDRVLLWVNDD